MKPKTPRTSPQREAHRRARTIRHDIGLEIAAMRDAAGLSRRALAVTAGISPSTLTTIEDGTRSPSIDVLARVSSALGGSLGVRFFPGTGPVVLDHLQAAMLKALIAILDGRWRRRLEVAVYRPARGVIDLVLEDEAESVVVACEAQSQLRRLEQQVRWSRMKADALATSRTESPHLTTDTPENAAVAVSRLLLLRSVRSTRRVVAEFSELLDIAYPARHADLLAALTGGAPWPGPGIAWCTVDAEGARILERPPRGIRLGR